MCVKSCVGLCAKSCLELCGTAWAPLMPDAPVQVVVLLVEFLHAISQSVRNVLTELSIYRVMNKDGTQNNL